MNARAHNEADAIREYMDRGSYEAGTRAAIEATGITMKIRLGSGKPCPFGDARMNHYRFTIRSAKGSYSSDFWQSIAASAAGKAPVAYDILACLQWRTDEDNTVDFAASYGYTNRKEAERAFRACKRQSAGLARILSPEQVEILSAIS